MLGGGKSTKLIVKLSCPHQLQLEKVVILLLFQLVSKKLGMAKKMFAEMEMNGVGHLTVDNSMVRSSIWVAFIATLFLFGSCSKKIETAEETGNSKFLGFVGADSLSKPFEFNEGNPIEISLDPAKIDSKVKLSDLMIDYRLVSLKNWEGGVVGAVDKILFTDSLVFVLDQYTYNSCLLYTSPSPRD